jgi:hypothetical protein
LLPFLAILLLLVALPVVFPLVTRPFNRQRVFGWIAPGVSILVIIIPFIVGFLFLLRLHNRADYPVAVQVPPLLTPLHNPPENQQYYQLHRRVDNPQDNQRPNRPYSPLVLQRFSRVDFPPDNQAVDRPDDRAACLPSNRAGYRQDNRVHDRPCNQQINLRVDPVDSQQANQPGCRQVSRRYNRQTSHSVDRPLDPVDNPPANRVISFLIPTFI